MHLKSIDNPELNTLVNDAFWGDFLVQVMNLGWEPLGTKLDDESLIQDSNWDSTNYFTSDGQIFTKEDLKAFLEVVDENSAEINEFLEGPDEIDEGQMDLLDFLHEAGEIRID